MLGPLGFMMDPYVVLRYGLMNDGSIKYHFHALSLYTYASHNDHCDVIHFPEGKDLKGTSTNIAGTQLISYSSTSNYEPLAINESPVKS